MFEFRLILMKYFDFFLLNIRKATSSFSAFISVSDKSISETYVYQIFI
jgi:hypothetical protein